MVSVTTRGFAQSRREASPFSLIESRGLIARLIDEFSLAGTEFVSNPRNFLTELLAIDDRDAKRRRRLYIGLSIAVAAHLAILGVIVVVGFRHFTQSVETKPELVVTLINPDMPLAGKETAVKPASEAKGDNGKGGGGGGDENPRPASQGALPPMLPAPQIVGPKPSPIEAPSLAVNTTLVGAPDNHPPEPHPGDPNGQVGPFSQGQGKGGGMGGEDGTGIGPNKGSGADRGNGGNKGGNTPGTPNGTNGTGIKEIDWSQHDKLAGFSRITWTYRPRPIVTPEAQAEKVVGTVVLRATFHADGTISDVEIVNPVSFMTDAAIESLMRSKFRPATLYGVPITLKRAPVTVEVHY